MQAGNPNEVKSESGKTVSQIVDEAFSEQVPPQETSPETVQPEKTQEQVPDTSKTETPEDSKDYTGIPKGYANDPAWQKREQLYKEAKAEAERLRSFEALLDDPVVLRRHLMRQGYSKAEISQVMRERGIQDIQEESKPSITQDEAESFAKDVCRQKGWDFDSLNQDQRSYIKDLIGMTDTVFGLRAKSLLDQRLKPIEEAFQSDRTQKDVNSKFEQAKSLASKHKFDFEKDILPSIQTKLNELDKIDPLRKIPFDVVSHTKDLVLQLVEERFSQQGRKEERQEVLKTAKPLRPGASIITDKASNKGKPIKQMIDEFYEAAGVRD